MRDLTPSHFRGALSISCHSVHELDDGRLLIVGDYASRLMRGDVKVDSHEAAIIIDRALLANVWPGGETGGIHAKAPDNPYEPIDENYTKPDVINVPQ